MPGPWQGNGSLVTGDLIKATAVGSVITLYRNGVQILQAVDGTWPTGSPGMGFFRRANGSQNTDFGLTNYAASN